MRVITIHGHAAAAQFAAELTRQGIAYTGFNEYTDSETYIFTLTGF